MSDFDIEHPEGMTEALMNDPYVRSLEDRISLLEEMMGDIAHTFVELGKIR